MIGRRQLPQAFQIRGLARQDMVLGNWFERFRSKRQIHRMARLALKVDGEPGENRVHCLDAPEPPTPMHAKAAIGQLYQ